MKESTLLAIGAVVAGGCVVALLSLAEPSKTVAQASAAPKPSGPLVEAFDRGFYACPRPEHFHEAVKIAVRRDDALLAHHTRANGCRNFEKGARHIQAEKQSFLCFSFREPDKFSIWYTCR